MKTDRWYSLQSSTVDVQGQPKTHVFAIIIGHCMYVYWW